MLINAFLGKTAPPNDDEVAAALGPTKKVWDQLLIELSQECGIDSQEWNSYSRKAGWSLRVKRGGRVIVYLAPSDAAFTASFALGDKALRAAHQSKLPAHIVSILQDAKRYAEGTAVRIEVRSLKDIAPVKTLVIAKLNN